MKNRRTLLLTFLFWAMLAQLYAQAPDWRAMITRCWREGLAGSLQLNRRQVLLYPGGTTIGATSDWLWNTFDAMNGSHDTDYYVPAQYNSFSSNYGLILYKMARTPNSDSTGRSQSQLLLSAMTNYIAAQYKFIWNKTIEDLAAELDKAGSLSFVVDTMVTSDYRSTSGADTSLYMQSVIHINVRMDCARIVTFYAKPYAFTNSSNAILLKYHPWYACGVLSAAYENKNYSVFNPNTWQVIFGVNGFMHNVCRALVVADSVNIRISATSYSYPLNRPASFSNSTTTSTSVPDTIFKSSYISPDHSPVLLGVVMYSIGDYVESCPK